MLIFLQMRFPSLLQQTTQLKKKVSGYTTGVCISVSLQRYLKFTEQYIAENPLSFRINENLNRLRGLLNDNIIFKCKLCKHMLR